VGSGILSKEILAMGGRRKPIDLIFCGKAEFKDTFLPTVFLKGIKRLTRESWKSISKGWIKYVETP